MKKAVVILAILTLALVAVALAANPKPAYKIGNEVYVCNCPEANCPCQTISKKPGKCPCGTDMIKAKVTGTVKGEVTLLAPGWEKDRVFSTEAKFACNCGPKCDCGTISQKAGKCPCGTEMKAIKK